MEILHRTFLMFCNSCVTFMLADVVVVRTTVVVILVAVVVAVVLIVVLGLSDFTEKNVAIQLILFSNRTT